MSPPLDDDLEWLHGYRLRASGAPRPSELESAERSIQADGWDDLDAVLKLIEQALAQATGGPGKK
jgi:hypothetical protein